LVICVRPYAGGIEKTLREAHLLYFTAGKIR
jgi:hypothetical protein